MFRVVAASRTFLPVSARRPRARRASRLARSRRSTASVFTVGARHSRTSFVVLYPFYSLTFFPLSL